MVVWLELAFLENFLMDAAILYSACFLSKIPVHLSRVLLGATLGAVFALLTPFITLPSALGLLLRVAVGIGLCLVVSAGKVKNGGDRVALNVLCFFFITVSTAGLSYAFPSVSPPLASASLAVVIVLFTLFSKALYRRRALQTLVFACVVTRDKNKAKAQGYYDSGNRAEKYGVPVCFISPELFFRLTDGDIFAEADEKLSVSTLNGKKPYKLFYGELEVYRQGRGKEVAKRSVYFAVSGHMLSREYQILLPACVLEGEGEGEGI
jgi:hypothetical protein